MALSSQAIWGPVGNAMHARPRFSLRMLLGAVMAFCIFVGLMTNWFDETGWVFWFVISPGAAVALLACLGRLARDASTPSRWQLVCCGVAGTILIQGQWQLLGHEWTRILEVMVVFFSLSLWVTEAAVWRALRCEPDAALPVEIKHAARLSLLVISSAVAVSILLFATAYATKGNWDREQVFRATLLVGCKGLVSAFPWIRLLRRRAVAHHRPGFAESASLTALVMSNLIALLAMAAAVMLWGNDWPGRRSIVFSKTDAFVLFYFFPLIAASAVALAGVFIQLWRDQWHQLVATMTCTLLTTNWLVNCFYYAAN